MKTSEYKIRFWNALAGFAVGSLLAAVVVSWIAPDKNEVIKLCRLDTASIKEDETKRHDWAVYSMNHITDQTSYIRQLIAHHELEISMSKRVLELNPNSTIQSLANNLITMETKEIATLKAMLAGTK